MQRARDSVSHPASEIALEVFRLNGALVAAGDALVAPLGLTSARWQVMGAIAQSDGGLPTAQIARNMGLARQSVQRVVNELAGDGIVRFEDNPHHKRAKLVRLTDEGAALFDEVMARWQPLAEALVEGVAPRTLSQTVTTLRTLGRRLETPAQEKSP